MNHGKDLDPSESSSKNNQYLELFIEEMQESLEVFEQKLLDLEKNPEDQDLLNEIFRVVHTMKGMEGALGFTALTNFTHEIENVLHNLRDGKLKIAPVLTEVLFACFDSLTQSLKTITQTGNEERSNYADLIARLHSLGNAEKAGDFFVELIPEIKKSLEIIASELARLKNTPENSEIIHNLFWAFHSMKGTTGVFLEDPIYRIAEYTESMLDECEKGNIRINPVTINLIRASAGFLNSISDDLSLNYNQDFLTSVETHLKELNDQKSHQIAIRYFSQEVGEYLHVLEETLREWEKDWEDCSRKDKILKIIQIIKELASSLDFTKMTNLTSDWEDLISDLHEQKLKVNRKLIELFLLERETLVDALATIIQTGAEGLVETESFINKLHQLVRERRLFDNNHQASPICELILFTPNETDGELGDPAIIFTTNIVIEQDFLNDFLIRFRETGERTELDLIQMESAPGDPVIMENLKRRFRIFKRLAMIMEQDLVWEIAGETELILDHLFKERLEPAQIIFDLVLRSSNYLRELSNNPSLNQNEEFLGIITEHLENLRNQELLLEKSSPEQPERQAKKIGEILIEQKKLTGEELDELLTKQKEGDFELKLGQLAVMEKKAAAQDVIESLRIQQKEIKSQPGGNSYIRVPSQKIDQLVDLMGELLIIHSLVEQEAGGLRAGDSFMGNLLRIGKITREIQSVSRNLQMVPLKTTFLQIHRVARDTILQLNKKNIILQMSGEETEIDRGVEEKILEPLMHLVKNAISHGIEEEQERLVKGKALQGLVKIEAYSKRGNIYIEVSDDGCGLSIDKIFQKAEEQNLVEPSVNYTTNDIMHFIFLPGFSTAETVNNVSGRGVGLDVVKTEVMKIGGKVEIENRPGQGCTFILKIPINLAVINGMIVDLMGTNYILPSFNVRQIVQVEEKQWVQGYGNILMVCLREKAIPVIPIERILGSTQSSLSKKNGLVVVLEMDQKLRALPVRGIIGRKEIVVKPLGNEFSNLKFINGATILGDGKVSLIFDVENLFKMGGES